MKKRLCMMVGAIAIAITAFAAINGTWVKVKDSCKKCSVVEQRDWTAHICGHCKDDTMYDEKNDHFWEGSRFVTLTLYKCKQCGHTSTWKYYHN